MSVKVRCIQFPTAPTRRKSMCVILIGNTFIRAAWCYGDPTPKEVVNETTGKMPVTSGEREKIFRDYLKVGHSSPRNYGRKPKKLVKFRRKTALTS